MLTLYGVYRSRASRPLWLLEECGTPFTHVPVIQTYRLREDQSRETVLHTSAPEFLAVNPMGQIPALTDGDLLLTESLAITSHIARRFGGMLGPQSQGEQALMEQWSLFAATGIETPALEILATLQAGNDSQPEGQAVLAVAAEKLRRPLKRLEGHLQAHDWLVGDRFTVADINAAECLRYAQGHSALIAEFPATKAWIERCQARPAFVKMWQTRNAEPE